jgi:hypothetical protein
MPTPLSAIAFQQLHSAASRVRPEETAFPHRYDHFNLYIHPVTDDPADASKIVHWGRQCWEAMQPCVSRAVYVTRWTSQQATSSRYATRTARTTNA